MSTNFQQQQQWAAGIANHIDKCLNQLTVYKFKQRVKQDVFTLLTNMPTLSVKIGLLTLNNGRQQTLLQLFGTVPMVYQGRRYQIPMCFWVVEMYPYHSPLCYVTPLKGMFIKPKHKYVDTSGRCYHPYLNQWNAKSCNLYTIVNILTGIFGNDPPIFRPLNKPTSTINMQRPPQNNQQFQNNNTINNNNNSSSSRRGFLGGIVGPSFKEQLTKKVKGEVKKLNVKLSSEMDKEMKTQDILNQRSKILDNHMTLLAKQKKEFLASSAQLKQENENVVNWVRQNNKEVDVDKEISPSDELSQQILELTALNSAIDDSLYYLGRALQKNALGIDDYLSSIKKLATEQFLAKALLNKINEH